MVFNNLKEIFKEKNPTLLDENLFNSTYDNQYWDPSGFKPDINILNQKNKKTIQKVNFMKRNFKKFILGYFVLVFLVLSFIFGLFIFSSTFDVLFFLFPVVVLVVIYFTFLEGLKSIKKDLLKLELANQNNWIYDPDKNYQLYNLYLSKFPEIFNLGEIDRNLEDIFWGSFQMNEQKFDFVSGLFNYARLETQSGKNKSKKKIVYLDHFFILRLPKRISSRFHLFPKTVFSKIGNFFTKKDIQTESLNFNEKFSFSYKEKNQEIQIDIMRILSPRVIEELVLFSETKTKTKKFTSSSLIGGVQLLFSDDFVIFSSSGPLIKKLNVELNPRTLEPTKEELENLNNEIDFYTNIGSEISKYLN